MDLKIEYVSFPSREDRSRYVAKRFAEYFKESVLDVGCFEAPLRKLLKGVKYTGVDFAGSPDIQLDLEKTESLPFGDKSFNTVICIDVLEHLENLHQIFAELVRVSDSYIIISLPNCWRDARVPIERGCGDFKHYGLPAEKPQDRHKWFFNISQGLDFVLAKSRQFNLNPIEIFATEKPGNFIARAARRCIYSRTAYLNRYANTLWVVYKK